MFISGHGLRRLPRTRLWFWSRLRQDHHAYGPHVQALEREFAAWNGNQLCMATNSGTSALHMCVAACGIEAGDEVITTALSWTSSATAIIHHSAVPVFVDVDWTSMHLDPSQIESLICDRTRAILVVHYWGVSCDMDPILDDCAATRSGRDRGRLPGARRNLQGPPSRNHRRCGSVQSEPEQGALRRGGRPVCHERQPVVQKGPGGGSF